MSSPSKEQQFGAPMQSERQRLTVKILKLVVKLYFTQEEETVLVEHIETNAQQGYGSTVTATAMFRNKLLAWTKRKQGKPLATTG